MAEVASYSLLFYGGPDGYQTNRAQIQLSDATGNSLAWIRFNDPGMFYETDYESAGIIRMHLPSGMFSERAGRPSKREARPCLLRRRSGLSRDI